MTLPQRSVTAGSCVIKMKACMARLIKESRIAANTSLSPATELAAKNKAHTSPTRAPDIAGLATPLSQEDRTPAPHRRVAALRRGFPRWRNPRSISLGSRTLPADGRRFTSGGELGDIQESPRSAAKAGGRFAVCDGCCRALRSDSHSILRGNHAVTRIYLCRSMFAAVFPYAMECASGRTRLNYLGRIYRTNW